MTARGRRSSKDVRAAADAHGHNWRSVERAKKALGVEATKPGYQQPWLWQLPGTKAAIDYKDRHPTDLWWFSEGDC